MCFAMSFGCAYAWVCVLPCCLRAKSQLARKQQIYTNPYALGCVRKYLKLTPSAFAYARVSLIVKYVYSISENEQEVEQNET